MDHHIEKRETVRIGKENYKYNSCEKIIFIKHKKPIIIHLMQTYIEQKNNSNQQNVFV